MPAIYVDEGGELPALKYLRAIPATPADELTKTIIAVVNMGPLRFPAMAHRWQLMRDESHKSTKGVRGHDLGGVFEARDKHDNVLYRVFCILDRDAVKWGIGHPLLASSPAEPSRRIAPCQQASITRWWRRVTDTSRCRSDQYGSCPKTAGGGPIAERQKIRDFYATVSW